MIKAEELRIRNWVIFTNSNSVAMPIEIDVFLLAYMLESDIDFVHHGYGNKYRQDSIKGIPLTIDLLEQIGFDTFEPNATFGPLHLRFDNNQIITMINGQVATKNIEYLHQLQNLYYLLVKEELKIDL